MFYDLKRTIIGTVNDMQISMWTDSYYPYISGVTRSIKLTKDTLTRMGHSVSVFCPSYPEANQEPNVYRFPSIKSPTKPDYYIAVPVNPKHLMAIKELAPDVIHAHSPFNLGKMGITVGTILDIPTVFTFHTMYNMYSHYVPLIGNSIAELIEFGAIGTAKSVDAVIAPSSAIRDYLRDHGVTTDIFVIPTGIEIDQFRNGDASYIRETYGVPDDLPILLTCGRLGREKNPECLLRAFSIIRKSLDSVLVMVGDGPLR
ncbi:MAG TPA: glycosyltransferase, partial [Bacillota bacterium]|nr:glycosyltransferase [Bacillota bacterium]